jgi:cobalt/nickel transport system permease protein
MHIPDGFLAPATYAPLLVLEAVVVYYAFKKTIKAVSDDSVLPFLASISAFSFVIMMFNVPIPGGTSGHALGVAILALLFGPWIAVFSLSVVLLLQALLFGDGGILSFGANALSMGFVGAFSAYYTNKLVSKFASQKISWFVAGYASTVVASLVVAVILGIQPMFFLDENGKAAFFPLGLNITIPALVGSHLLFFGILEGVITLMAMTLLKKVNIALPEMQK